MAVATDDAYSAASGVTMHVGRFAPPSGPPATVALVGDSLTALSYGPLHPYGWTLGGLKTIANAGVASDTIQNVLSRIDNSYTAGSPGLAGLPEPLGWVVLRIGTNNFREGASLTTTTQNAYIALFDRLLSYASRVMVMAVPPVYDVGDSRGNGIPGVNAWLSSYCAGREGMHFVDDCADVRNGGNWADSAYASDGIHFSNRGSYMLGKTGAPLVAAILAPYGYAPPLVTDAADKYPSTNNWVQNSVMAGAGTVPTGWTVGQQGSGNSVTTSIVPADGGDANSVPWLRVTPSSVGANTTWITLRASLLFPPITLSAPDVLDICTEVRFNDLDASRFLHMWHFVYGTDNENLSPPAYLRLSAPELVNRTLTWRTAVRRSGTRKDTHPSAYIDWRMRPSTAFTGAMGSFDVRCLSIRAS